MCATGQFLIRDTKMDFYLELVSIGAKPHFVKKYLSLLSSFNDYRGDGEKHHILPVSLFPEYTKSSFNIVKLPYRVHYIVHLCLALALPGTSMVNAVMILRRADRKVNSHLFAKMRKKFAQRLSETNRGENNPMYGTKRSNVAKEMTSTSLLKFYEEKRKSDPDLKIFFSERNSKVKRGREHHCYGNRLTNQLTTEQERKRVESFTRASREKMPWEKPRWKPERDQWWCWAAHIHYYLITGKSRGEALKEVFGSNDAEIWAQVRPIILRLDSGWDPLTCHKWLNRYGIEFQ
nr:homing endonuclease [Klebsiella phage vB_Ko_K5lambda5]